MKTLLLLLLATIAVITATDGGFGKWSSWSVCTKTCGGGYHKRTRKCDNPPPSHGGKDCNVTRDETKACTNDFCKGPAGLAKAQELVETFLESFHKNKYPDKTPSAKFYKSIFEIQKAVAEEFISVDPTSKNKPLDQRQKDLEEISKAATYGGSTDFARNTLGKGLFTFTKQKVAEGLPIDALDLAASVYLDNKRKEVGDDIMNGIIASKGDATLMFTMDTTSSMSHEINSAKAIAKQIINSARDFQVDYILSPFNDPDTGPVTYRSGVDRLKFISDIEGLKARGGGDCPELAFKGMLDAFDQGPKFGSPMFVFTDAPAKDATTSNEAALISLANMQESSMIFFTNLNGCGSKSDMDRYKKIATATSGQVFQLANDAEMLKLIPFVHSCLQKDTQIGSGGSSSGRYKRSIGRSHSFNVDDSIAKLIISVDVEKRNSAQYVILKKPNGNIVRESAIMSMARIFEIADPQAGVWLIEFPNNVGKYEYNMQAVSKFPIEFTYNFMYQQSERKNSPPFSMPQPFKGRENMMVIRIGGIDRIEASSLQVAVVDTHGNMLIKDKAIKKLGSKSIYSTKILPPDVPFKIRLSGQTKSGNKFERISNGISKAVTAYMRVTYAGNEFTATIGKGSVAALVQVLNVGDLDTITFNVTASIGSIPTNTQSKTIRNMGFIQIDYIPPNDNNKYGKVDRITITAQKQKTGEIFTQNISILLIKQKI